MTLFGIYMCFLVDRQRTREYYPNFCCRHSPNSKENLDVLVARHGLLRVCPYFIPIDVGIFLRGKGCVATNLVKRILVLTMCEPETAARRY